jgi:hypothetical protein
MRLVERLVMRKICLSALITFTLLGSSFSSTASAGTLSVEDGAQALGLKTSPPVDLGSTCPDLPRECRTQSRETPLESNQTAYAPDGFRSS